jgi:hypothetical protein
MPVDTTAAACEYRLIITYLSLLGTSFGHPLEATAGG